MKKIIITLVILAVIGVGAFFGVKAYKAHNKNTNPVNVYSIASFVGNYYEYNDQNLYGNVKVSNEQKIKIDTDKIIDKVDVKPGDVVRVGDPIMSYVTTRDELKLASLKAEKDVMESNMRLLVKELDKLNKITPVEKHSEYYGFAGGGGKTGVATSSDADPVATDPDADPDKPDNPDNPDDPDNPDNSDDPDFPDFPDDPDFPDNPDDPDFPDFPIEPEYTKEELEIAIQKKTNEIADLQNSIDKQELTIKKQELAITKSQIVAKVNGTVIKVETSEESIASGEAGIIISPEGTRQARLAIDEWHLYDVRIGESVSLMSYDTGSSYYGEVVEIGDSPVSRGDEEVSYYPVVVAIEGGDDLTSGGYVEATLEGGSSEAYDPNEIVLPLFFVKQENGKYYVMKEKDGRLVKQYISTGKIYYGEMISVKKGLSAKDKLAFPYEKDAVEGKVCEEAELMDLY